MHLKCQTVPWYTIHGRLSTNDGCYHYHYYFIIYLFWGDPYNPAVYHNPIAHRRIFKSHYSFTRMPLLLNPKLLREEQEAYIYLCIIRA